jgi:phage virion morphogenesis protein
VAALFTFSADGTALVRAQRRLGRLDQVIDRDLGAALAEVLEAQTRRRILVEKRAPDGTKWPKWSDNYAKTRGGGDSLLVDSHDLEKSVKGEGHGKDATVLADTVYAAAQNFGYPARNLPARTFLGISTENEAEIGDTLRAVLEDALEESGPHTRRGKVFRSGGH